MRSNVTVGPPIDLLAYGVDELEVTRRRDVFGLILLNAPLVAVLALIALISLLLSFGGYAPFYRLAYDLMPGLNSFRVPARFLFLVSFAGSLLSAIGIENWIAMRRKVQIAVLVGLAAFWIGIGGLGYWYVTRPGHAGRWPGNESRPAWRPDYASSPHTGAARESTTRPIRPCHIRFHRPDRFGHRREIMENPPHPVCGAHQLAEAKNYLARPRSGHNPRRAGLSSASRRIPALPRAGAPSR